MFTREEALALWDDLTADSDAFLCAFGEVVLLRQRERVGGHFHLGEDGKFGYFIRAKNHCFTQEMFAGYNRVCEKHNCTYRIETRKKSMVLLFYKDDSRRNKESK